MCNAYIAPDRRLSVCLSHAGVLSRRMNGWSWFIAYTRINIANKAIRGCLRKKHTSLRRNLELADFSAFRRTSYCQLDSTVTSADCIERLRLFTTRLRSIVLSVSLSRLLRYVSVPQIISRLFLAHARSKCRRRTSSPKWPVIRVSGDIKNCTLPLSLSK